MNKQIFDKYLPYLAAVLIFILVTFAYFPEVLEGKRISSHDVSTWIGGSQEILDYKETTGEHSLWTNSMFSGMPGYLLTNYTPNNWIQPLNQTLNANENYRPVSFIFWAMLGFFVALLLFRVNPWLAIVGAIAYAFSSYFFIIIEAGHSTKMSTLAYMPPIIAGAYHAYKENMLKGAVVMMFFLALQLYRNHFQITYYTFIIILIFGIFHLVEVVKTKEYKKFALTTAALAVAALIALAANYTAIATTLDYGKDSIRGKSELTIDTSDQTDGLDISYALGWSYGKIETLDLLIPNLVGGSSMGALPENSAMEKELTNLGAQNVKELTKQMPTYWGPQPSTSGPVYIGAFIVFLFVFGLFIVKNNIRWWMLSATILSILLAWGSNFQWFSELFLHYMPGYNKFRTVSMILIIAEFAMPLLGILAVNEIIENKVTKKQILKGLAWAGGIVGGIILILLMNPGILTFTNGNEAGWFARSFGLKNDEQSQQIINSLVAALESDRAAMFRADAMRSLAFIAAGVAVLLLFVFKKLPKNGFYAALALVILIDLWGVNKRYLNSEDFVSKRQVTNPYNPTLADNEILKDKDPDFRVANLAVSTFNDASTSYFHKSIGGYHGAKMRRYQELVDYKISTELDKFVENANSATSDSAFQAVFSELPILNMLNTKYIIGNPDAAPLKNPAHLGNAWFVENLVQAKNADEELAGIYNPNKIEQVLKVLKERVALLAELKKISNELQDLVNQGKSESPERLLLSENYNKKMGLFQAAENELAGMNDFNPAKTAVADVKFKAQFFEFTKDSAATIQLTSYAPNKLIYKAKAKSDQLAVFSEIYYGEKGWNVYIDGKPAPHFRANYVLRAMKVPAGEHEITFKFEPEVWKKSNIISLIGSVLFVLAILGYGFWLYKNGKKSARAEK